MLQPISSASRQMSEAFRTVLFLSLSGGLQDAYTYLGRGKVFANAQTGNIVFMGQSLFTGDWARFFHYLVPVLAFALGVAAAELIRVFFKENRRLHWRQLVLLTRDLVLLLFLVGFFPDALNLAANALVLLCLRHAGTGFPQGARLSLCQHHVHRQPAQRHGFLVTGLRLHDRKTLGKAGHYFAVILLFALGAGVGAQCMAPLGLRTIWISLRAALRQPLPDVPQGDQPSCRNLLSSPTQNPHGKRPVRVFCYACLCAARSCPPLLPQGIHRPGRAAQHRQGQRRQHRQESAFPPAKEGSVPARGRTALHRPAPAPCSRPTAPSAAA